MKARDVIGRKIVAVHQTRFYNEHMKRFSYEINSITLDDGRRIYFSTEETIECAAVIGDVVKQEQRA